MLNLVYGFMCNVFIMYTFQFKLLSICTPENSVVHTISVVILSQPVLHMYLVVSKFCEVEICIIYNIQNFHFFVIHSYDWKTMLQSV
jgi:hypothetical protein